MIFDGWIGLDIGGANIKVSIYRFNDRGNPKDESRSIPFQLWKHPEQLTTVLTGIFSLFRDQRMGIAVTMTGELADGFPNRQTGVESIVDAVRWACESVPSNAVDSFHPLFYGIGEVGSDLSACGHQWHTAESAKRNWTRVAAANWHAIASSVVTLPDIERPVDGFLIDIGSTTTDVIPIRDCLIAARGLTDTGRLQSGELYYAGVARTPICSLVQRLMIDGQPVSIARELFATVEDAFLVSGDADEVESRLDTADGRPATRAFAAQRLARMVCADALVSEPRDSDEQASQAALLSHGVLRSLASQVISALESGIAETVKRVIELNRDLPLRFFLSGQGAWVARRVLTTHFASTAELLSIADIVGRENSQAMAAYAVAHLAAAEHSNPTLKRTERPSSSCSVSPDVECGSSSLSASPFGSKKKSIRVIKIGGSLLNWPNSPQRIRHWLKDLSKEHTNLWLVGGGKTVEQIREFSAKFQLHDSLSHQLALEAMSMNLKLVHHWFADWNLIDDPRPAVKGGVGNSGCQLLFDFSQWLKLEAERIPAADSLPETWDISSDSCAAFLARYVGATELVLLKSCPIDKGLTLAELSIHGIVDRKFPEYASSIPSVILVNLRES